MSICIEKIPHDTCGSSDALQVFYDDIKDIYTGYCFNCNTWLPDPYKGREPTASKHKKTEEELREEVTEIQRLPIFNLPIRSIPPVSFKQWGCRLSVSEYDGKTPFAIHFGYQNPNGKVVAWKTRPLEKKAFWCVGNISKADPFGFSRALSIASKTLYITEGEFDAIALEVCLKNVNKQGNYKNKEYSVISLTRGWGSITKDLDNIRSRIKGVFKEIVLVMDDDEKGKEAEKAAQRVMPDILIASKAQGCKDANECLIKGRGDELAKNVLWNAHRPPIKGIVRVSDCIDRALETPVAGLSYPFVEFDEMCLGQRFGELVSVGGGVGTGKTLLAHEWAAHNMMVHDLPCFAVLLEEQNHMSLRNIAGKIDSIPYHVPGTIYDKDKFKETAYSMSDHLFLWESDEDQSLRFDLDEIIEAIRFNAQEYGCKFHYIDNMTRLVDHLPATEANEFINKYSSILEGLTTQLDINITVFSHLNNTGNVPHESGGRVLSSQFTGSRGLMRASPMMIGFERNKHGKEGRADNSYLTVIKNRKYGLEGRVKMKYERTTGRLEEFDWEGDSLIEEEKN